MTKMDYFRPRWDQLGPKWPHQCLIPVQNKVILTRMSVWTIWSSALSSSTAATPYYRLSLLSQIKKGHRDFETPSEANASDSRLSSLVCSSVSVSEAAEGLNFREITCECKAVNQTRCACLLQCDSCDYNKSSSIEISAEETPFF